MNQLHIDSITKSFGEKKILQDIYLKSETGKITGLLGRNGEGKSTLMQIIFGTLKADTYFIKYNSTILKNLRDRKNKIAYLPQHPFLPKNTKIKNLIPLFCSTESADLLFKHDLINPFLDRTSKNLSAGEQRIVEVLLIAYSIAEFILLDEPFHSLSPKIIYELKRIIKEISKQKGLIVSDHNYQDVLDVSQEIYLLSETHLRQIKNIKDLELYNYLSKSI